MNPRRRLGTTAIPWMPFIGPISPTLAPVSAFSTSTFVPWET